MKKLILFVVLSVLTVFSSSYVSAQVKRDTLVVQDEWTVGGVVSTQDDKSRGEEGREMIVYKSSKSNDFNDRNDKRKTKTSAVVLAKPKTNIKSKVLNTSYITLGLVNFISDDMLYKPSDGFMELDWARSFSFSYTNNFAEIAPFNHNGTGVYFGVGFEYQRLCFANNQSITQDANGDILSVIYNSDCSVKRSTLKNLYVKMPVTFDLCIDELRLSVGCIGALRVHTKTKVVYHFDGDKIVDKESNSFTAAPFKLDATARLVFKTVGVFCTYTLSDTYTNSSMPNVHPLTVGLCIEI